MSAIPTSVSVTANTWTAIISPVSGAKTAMFQLQSGAGGYQWRVDTSTPEAGEPAWNSEEYPRRLVVVDLSDTHGIYVYSPAAATFTVSTE